jgi:hypothetical protein
MSFKIISEAEFAQTLQTTLVTELRKIVASEVMAAMGDHRDELCKLVRPIAEEAVAQTLKAIEENEP